LGGLDLSALIAFFALQISGSLLNQLALSLSPSFSSFQ
jgi:uncharacterized protein YggT (Ycf19 family)